MFFTSAEASELSYMTPTTRSSPLALAIDTDVKHAIISLLRVARNEKLLSVSAYLSQKVREINRRQCAL